MLVGRNRSWAYSARRSTREAICSSPSSRSHHSAPTTYDVSSPRGGRVAVGQARVLHAGVAADDRVLPGGDAERVQVALPLEQPASVVLRADVRREHRDQRHRALVQGAGRAAVGVALDAAVGGVGGRGVDPGELEGPAVDPGAVVVAVGQERRPVRDDPVEVGGGGGAAREGRHRPAAAEDPGPVGVRGGVRRDRGEVVLAGRALGQVAADPLQPALHRVHVGVDEAGRQQAAGQVDHPGARARLVLGQSAGVLAQVHPDDPTVPDDRGTGAGVPVPVEERTVPEHRRGHARLPIRCSVGRVRNYGFRAHSGESLLIHLLGSIPPSTMEP